METKNSGLLIIFSGPSGAGKGTVLQRLFELRSDCVCSVSCTTRAPRPGEVDGVNYHFISTETFDNWVERDKFIEWDRHFSASYVTPKEFVEEQLHSGKHVFLEIDVNGGQNVMRKIPGCLSIFLMPPSWEILEDRLKGRGTETAEQLEKRFSRARFELDNRQHYAYTVINDDVDRAAQLISSIIDAEMARTQRVPSFQYN